MPLADELKDALVHEVLIRLYDESLPRILTCLDQLEEAQVWWRPNESSNSVGNLVLHLSGNVRQWIYSGLGGFNDSRRRQTEFDERGPISKKELIHLLTTTMEMVRPVFNNLPVEVLLQRRPVQTFTESGLTILVHVTEHFSYHTGQIAFITKMLKDKSLEFYESITLE